MTDLQLIIKQHYLEEIVAGTKTKETRDIRPKTAKKYIIDDGVSELKPVHYDTITFFGGYNTNRKTAKVEVKSALISLLVDDDGNNVTYEENGEEFVEAIIEYELGKVLSHNF